MKAITESERDVSRWMYRPYVWLLGSLVLLILLLTVSSARQRVAPDELVGEWTTSEPAYKDRCLTIYSGVVSFGTGDGTVSSGFIRRVEKVSRGGEVIYSLFYEDDDGEQQLSLSFEPATGFLRLHNQPRVVWKKSRN